MTKVFAAKAATDPLSYPPDAELPEASPRAAHRPLLARSVARSLPPGDPKTETQRCLPDVT
jgi:hypothetical protein